MTDRMPQFIKLESIKLYGIPTRIDGVDLTLTQARVLVEMVGKVWRDGMDLSEAVKVATPAFRKSYTMQDGKWVSRAVIRLTGGREYRNRFHDSRESGMGRTRESGKSVVAELMESGARNSKRDHAAIMEVIKQALGQLEKEDRLQALKSLGYKVRK